MKVTVYSTPTCPYCKMAKDFLKARKVRYTDINVAEDKKKAQEMIKRSGQMGVPVIDVDGELIIGFDKDAIERAISK